MDVPLSVPSLMQGLFPSTNNGMIRGSGILTWLSAKAGLIKCSKPTKATISFQLKDFCDSGVTDLNTVLRVGFHLSFHAIPNTTSPKNEWIANYVTPVIEETITDGGPELNLEEAFWSSDMDKTHPVKGGKDTYSLELEIKALTFLFQIFQKSTGAVQYITLSNLHSRISNSCEPELIRYIGSSSMKRRQFIEDRLYIFNLGQLGENDVIYLQAPEVYLTVTQLAQFLLKHGGVTSSDMLFRFFQTAPSIPLPIRDRIQNKRSHFMQFLAQHPFVFAPFPAQFYVGVRRNLPYFDYGAFIRKSFPNFQNGIGTVSAVAAAAASVRAHSRPVLQSNDSFEQPSLLVDSITSALNNVNGPGGVVAGGGLGAIANGARYGAPPTLVNGGGGGHQHGQAVVAGGGGAGGLHGHTHSHHGSSGGGGTTPTVAGPPTAMAPPPQLHHHHQHQHSLHAQQQHQAGATMGIGGGGHAVLLNNNHHHAAGAAAGAHNNHSLHHHHQLHHHHGSAGALSSMATSSNINGTNNSNGGTIMPSLTNGVGGGGGGAVVSPSLMQQQQQSQQHHHHLMPVQSMPSFLAQQQQQQQQQSTHHHQQQQSQGGSSAGAAAASNLLSAAMMNGLGGSQQQQQKPMFALFDLKMDDHHHQLTSSIHQNGAGTAASASSSLRSATTGAAAAAASVPSITTASLPLSGANGSALNGIGGGGSSVVTTPTNVCGAGGTNNIWTYGPSWDIELLKLSDLSSSFGNCTIGGGAGTGGSGAASLTGGGALDSASTLSPPLVLNGVGGNRKREFVECAVQTDESSFGGIGTASTASGGANNGQANLCANCAQKL
ncbi:hypothetical protein niasHT_039146 [Heterodera trifolii]|uniref:Lin-66-like winged helix domain-containing protein n=1 Tax=Heterodera trifolii TaxID=157864 RepID=A0ABD2HTF9_9BILA